MREDNPVVSEYYKKGKKVPNYTNDILLEKITGKFNNPDENTVKNFIRLYYYYYLPVSMLSKLNNPLEKNDNLEQYLDDTGTYRKNKKPQKKKNFFQLFIEVQQC